MRPFFLKNDFYSNESHIEYVSSIIEQLTFERSNNFSQIYTDSH